MESRKVWCPPQQETEVNLNQTVVDSENPLNLNNLFEFRQLGSMDFLSSDNLNSMVDFEGKLVFFFFFFLQIHVYKLLI